MRGCAAPGRGAATPAGATRVRRPATPPPGRQVRAVGCSLAPTWRSPGLGRRARAACSVGRGPLRPPPTASSHVTSCYCCWRAHKWARGRYQGRQFTGGRRSAGAAGGRRQHGSAGLLPLGAAVWGSGLHATMAPDNQSGCSVAVIRLPLRARQTRGRWLQPDTWA